MVLNSQNSKLGKGIAATYVSQTSCPRTCPFLENSCYAELGLVGIYTRRLNRSPWSQLELAQNEAAYIYRTVEHFYGDGQYRRLNLKPKWHWYHPLRGHVVGDSRTVAAVKLVAKAYELWQRWFGPVWTYTHAWKRIARKHWRGVSILASCESMRDVGKALDRGYAAALVVDSHSSPKAWTHRLPCPDAREITIVPCPNQTKQVTCSQCKLCWKDQWLLESRTVIAFAAHGSKKETIKSKLIQIETKDQSS